MVVVSEEVFEAAVAVLVACLGVADLLQVGHLVELEREEP